ncbi:hypothetical protein ACFU96_21400 [Streptomyces sp. NPDC057620]|uniref:hypothetical protein n=1 Tax=Streptomyces sp. NPDC057620 TaxID=3346185 RepID=UPI003696B3D2
MSTTPARTIRLQHVGLVPAVEAQELTVGDTLMWNEGVTNTVTAVADVSPKFLRITEKSTRTGEEHDRRMMKTRLVARVDRAKPKETAGRVDRWSVQDREGNEVAEVEATGYDHAVQVAAQDSKVRAAEPGSGGLVYMRRGAVQKSAPAAVEGRSVSTYGALKATLEVPQVYAAIRVLKAGQQVLGGFADTGHCVSAGAYLDARRDTGEVVLSCEPTHVRPAGSVLRELLDERERAVAGYAVLFRTAGWYVQEIRENGQDGRRRLARLIMELPTALPGRSRVRRTSDGRFGTITDFSGDDRMVITWDRAVFPDPFHRTTAELMGPAYQVFPAVDHCSGCGEIVRDDDVEDSYTTCCNEGACSGCAAVNGVYACGTKAPTGTDE